MTLRQRFDALVADPSPATDALDALWSDLPVLDASEMLGAWRGGDFSTGHPASALLTTIGWHGKRFDSLTDGHPLICRGEDGALYSNTRYAGGGYSSLWNVEFRGESTATMVYDGSATFDHFKRVDDHTLMGIMNGKLEAAFGTADHYYFWLERDRG